MNRAGGFSLVLLLAGSGFGQTRSFGSVVFPGGTHATNPNITRTFGSVVFPGGSSTTPVVRTAPPAAHVPVFVGGNSFNRGSGNVVNSPHRGGNGRRSQAATYYSYPVYVPGYYDSAAYGDQIAPLAQPQQQPGNVTVVYPQQQQQEVRPIIIQLGTDANGQFTQTSRRPAAPPEEEPAAEPDQPHYLIAFKDHTIYTSVAYWFDGDTLHYFTKGDTHNQVSVALIDRPLTERLNRELGIDFKMPPAK
jgi:hypothetical protein